MDGFSGSGSTAASQVNSTSVPTPTDSLAGVRVAKDAGVLELHQRKFPTLMWIPLLLCLRFSLTIYTRIVY